MPEDHAEPIDVVVVGSGFGGAVAEHKMACDGRSVVALERARAGRRASSRAPLSRCCAAFGTRLWATMASSTSGLSALWGGVVATGLGNGPLIYGNVLLRKDEKWFVHYGGALSGTEEDRP